MSSTSSPAPALIRLLLRSTASLHARSPFLSTLLPSIGLAAALQGATAVPSILAESERFYDLSGSVTYLSCTAFSLALPALRAKYGALGDGASVAATARWDGFASAVRRAMVGGATGGVWSWRMLALSTAAGIWASRLGSYLFQRISQEGSDSRFTKIRGSPPKFAAAFLAQAAWISLVLLPVLSVNALPAAASAGAFGLTDALAAALWTGGFALEVGADRQKARWAADRAAKRHSEQFLTSGLWGQSRHPNYFGETSLWTGVAVGAAGVLAAPAGLAGVGLGGGVAGRLAALAMAGVSPAFTAFLLLKVSGVPMSERKYDRRFKGNPAYEKWKRETPMFFPKLW